jgi:hypothetical protein
MTNLDMERRALLLALALTLPLILYGIPYAYAATISSSYVVNAAELFVPAHSGASSTAFCHAGDYATGGGFLNVGPIGVVLVTESAPPQVAGQPSAWRVNYYNQDPVNQFEVGSAFAICQTPITVAGIGVPEFGSLYVAIALGAVLYFLLSKRFTRSPTIPRQVKT